MTKSIIKNFSWLVNLKNILQHNTDEIIIDAKNINLFSKNIFTESQKSPFIDQDEMTYELQRFCFFKKIRLDPLCPFAGGQIFNYQFRWHCVIKPAICKSPILIIRKHKFYTLSIKDFIEDNNHKKKLDYLFHYRHNLIICGPCGSGKTSLCYTLLKKYANSEKICFLEDYSEIPLDQPLWIKLLKNKENIEGKGIIDFETIFSEALRLSPQRIILGEVKTNELKIFFNASLSGHGGSMTTFHCNSVVDFIIKTKLLIPQYQELSQSILEKIYLIFMQRKKGIPKIKDIVNLEGYFNK